MGSLKYYGLRHALKAKEAKDPNFFYVYNKKDQVVVMISGFLYWILELCSKENITLENLICQVSERYEKPLDEASIILEEALHKLENENLIITSELPLEHKTLKIVNASSVDRALVALTNACNFNCIHCLQGEEHPKFVNELSTEEWKDVIHQLDEFGIFHIFITGGEPLLRNDFIEILQEADKHDLAITVFTNASLLTSDLCEKLSGFDSLRVQVSLHDLDPEKSDHFTQVPNSYEKALKGIKLLTENKVYVAVGTAFRSVTLKDMEKFYSLLSGLGVKEWVSSLIMPLGCAKINWEELTMTSSEFKEYLDMNFKLMEKHKNSLPTIGCVFNMDLLKGKHEQWEHATVSFGCNLYNQYINILSDGTLTPCDRLPFLKLGNLKNKSLVELFNDTQTIEAHRKIAKLMTSDCDDCKAGELCGYGCAGIIFAAKDVATEHPDPLACRLFDEGLPIILSHSGDFAKKKIMSLMKDK